MRLDRSTCDRLVMPRAEQKHHTDRAHDYELHRVPQADQDDEIQPSRSTLADQSRAPDGDHQVGHGDEHRGHTPLQPLPSADKGEKDVGRHATLHKRANVDAQDPD